MGIFRVLPAVKRSRRSKKRTPLSILKWSYTRAIKVVYILQSGLNPDWNGSRADASSRNPCGESVLGQSFILSRKGSSTSSQNLLNHILLSRDHSLFKTLQEDSISQWGNYNNYKRCPDLLAFNHQQRQESALLRLPLSPHGSCQYYSRKSIQNCPYKFSQTVLLMHLIVFPI